MSAQSIYSALPVWAQHAAISAYGLYWHRLRFGGGYSRAVAAYRDRDQWDTEQWSHYLQGRLLPLLSAAAERVPYYRERWNPTEKAAARSGRLTDLPLLEKDALRADPIRFLREDAASSSRKTFHTSGSTGTPIATVWTPEEVRRSRAVREVRSNGWAGVSFDERRATFSGRMVVPDPQSRGPFYRFNAVERQVYFSAFHVKPETAAGYVEALRRHRTQWLSGYAVSFYRLARFILEQNLSVPPLKAVITTSEKVTPEMRRTMEEAYGCPVFEEYGTVENIMLATQCEAGRLHVSPDVGIVEILRPDGTPCGPREPGEVVATGLMRELQPLVRFRLGDVAEWDDEACPCGRGMPVLREVIGRLEDIVIGPDGREVVRFHGLFVGQARVREGQVIQETLDRMRIRVVTLPGFDASDEADLIARVHARLGDRVDVVVEQVSDIPRTRAGKFKAVISHVSNKNAAGQSGSDA